MDMCKNDLMSADSLGVLLPFLQRLPPTKVTYFPLSFFFFEKKRKVIFSNQTHTQQKKCICWAMQVRRGRFVEAMFAIDDGQLDVLLAHVELTIARRAVADADENTRPAGQSASGLPSTPAFGSAIKHRFKRNFSELVGTGPTTPLAAKKIKSLWATFVLGLAVSHKACFFPPYVAAMEAVGQTPSVFRRFMNNLATPLRSASFFSKYIY